MFCVDVLRARDSASSLFGHEKTGRATRNIDTPAFIAFFSSSTSSLFVFFFVYFVNCKILEFVVLCYNSITDRSRWYSAAVSAAWMRKQNFNEKRNKKRYLCECQTAFVPRDRRLLFFSSRIYTPACTRQRISRYRVFPRIYYVFVTWYPYN